jgi:MFS superfamily sulfate permease-like transporter
MSSDEVGRQPVAGGEPEPERPEPPKDYLPGLAENWKNDAVSGFVIFLIALPLCLGIASGFPPIAGIISGIIAGMLVSLISGSHVTINGPAAGMIVIVLGAVQELGGGDAALGYQLALAVGVVAGVIQIGLAFIRAGKLTGFFASSVIHGMLAGIGLIIMAGQIHIALGRENPGEHGLGILTAIPPTFLNLNPYVALIGLAAVLIMVFWPKMGRIAGIVPAPLVAVVIGTLMAIGLGVGSGAPYTLFGNTYETGAQFLVPLPEGGLLAGFAFPDFSQILTGTSIKWIFLFVFVASLESLLTAEAVDKIDPYKRQSNMNKELFGKGVGNALSSGIGGLPMIAEVVRSKANILQGAKTRWSNFFHGFFLLAFVLAVPGLLSQIPLSALAGVLLVIGFRLAHPKEFGHALHVGRTEFLFMLVTAITVLLTDLLIGVATGLIVAFIIAFVVGRTKPSNVFKPKVDIQSENGTVPVNFSGALGFHNFLGIRSRLDSVPEGKNIVMDFSGVHFIDHTVMDRLSDFDRVYTDNGGEVEWRNMDHLEASGHDDLSPRRGTPVAAEETRTPTSV